MPCVALVLSSYMPTRRNFTVYTQLLNYWSSRITIESKRFKLSTSTYHELRFRFRKPASVSDSFWNIIEHASIYLTDEKMLDALSYWYPDKTVIPLAKLLPTVYNEPEPDYFVDECDMSGYMFNFVYEHIMKLMWSKELNLFQELLLFRYKPPEKPGRNVKIRRTALEHFVPR